MKEHLNDITRELQEINNKELTQQEKKENEKLYKKELKIEIKGTIQQEIEKQLEEGEALKDIYNFLIVNDDTIKDNIFNTLYNYTIKIKRVKPAPEYVNESKNKKEFIYLVNYPFKCFDIGEDIDNLYYTILKNIINKYTLKLKVKEKELQEELKETFFEVFKKYGYTRARELIFDDIIKNSFIKKVAEDKEELNFLNNIYLKTAKDTEKDFLLLYPQPKQTKTTYKNNNRIKHRKTILMGSIVYGFLNGIVKASRK